MARLKAGVAAQEIKLVSMRGYLTESSPDFKQAQVEMAALRGQLARAESEEPAIVGTSGGASDYIAKFRNFKYQETLFELFAKQYEMARLDESREGSVIQVLDIAEPPEYRNSPKKALVALITTLATGFLILLFVFLRHALRGAAQNPEAAEKLDRLRLAWCKALGQRRATTVNAARP